MSRSYKAEYTRADETSDIWPDEIRPIGNRAPLPSENWPQSSAAGHHAIAARGFAQAFGLHAAVTVATVAVDMMTQAATIVSAGLLIPVSLMAGVVLGVIAYLAQRRWFNDTNESALIKALIVALLTAIPSPLPYVLFVPAGIVGLFRKK